LRPIGNTPLISLDRIIGDSDSKLLAKLETYNPSGSVKDRVAHHMLHLAEERGQIFPGDTIIAATSGNMGIALAMISLVKDYRVMLVVPTEIPEEMRGVMTTLGAELIFVSEISGMEAARVLSYELEEQGVGKLLDQFSNPDNPNAHYETTGPEIWRDTKGDLTHLVCSMGTTGTIVGAGKYLKEKNPDLKIIGVRPIIGSNIFGMINWQSGFEPSIYSSGVVDEVIEITPDLAAQTAMTILSEEGIFMGISSGGAMAAAIRLARRQRGARIVTVIVDRGDRYVSTGLFH
jgi:cysteine synthase B